LGLESVKNGGQSLLFAETRTRSSSLATKAADAISKSLKKSDKIELEKISKKLLENNEHTELLKTLASLIKKGVAFHHAGLNQNCRQTVESEFRNGKIKLIAATPTLAEGVNLQARRVVISVALYQNKYKCPINAVNNFVTVFPIKNYKTVAQLTQYDQ